MYSADKGKFEYRELVAKSKTVRSKTVRSETVRWNAVQIGTRARNNTLRHVRQHTWMTR